MLLEEKSPAVVPLGVKAGGLASFGEGGEPVVERH